MRAIGHFRLKHFKDSRNENEYYPIEVKVEDTAEEDIRAFLGYGQILNPKKMRLKAREILEDSIQMYN